MKKNIQVILEYDGTRYDGWQKQGNTENTIQGKLETVDGPGSQWRYTDPGERMPEFTPEGRARISTWMQNCVRMQRKPCII